MTALTARRVGTHAAVLALTACSSAVMARQRHERVVLIAAWREGRL